MNKDLSIIIPCYNSGNYLTDATGSIRNSNDLANYNYEIIVVNDGSTDTATLEILSALEADDCTVYHQENAGPAAARNHGVKLAKGRYLLFLDSDNRLLPNFIQQGISLLDSTDADIIHGKPTFFGTTTEPRFITGPLIINKLIVQNYIDICCVMRREVLTRINGFDEDRKIIGFEDWELHLNAYCAGCKYHFIDEEVYEYRVVPDSLSQRHSPDHVRGAYTYIHTKYASLVSQVLYWYWGEYNAYRFDMERPLRSFFKYYYKKFTR